jgi:polyisoprenoid-binding protein YceI
MKTSKTLLYLGLLITALSLSAYAQGLYRLNSTPELKISGTSTLHDWDMISNSAKGEAVIFINNNKLERIEKLKVAMPAETLKSGKTQMDNNAYKALKTKEHKEVSFELKELYNINSNKFKAKGLFEIAGTKRVVDLNVEYIIANNAITFTGNTAFKLTDFGITPPTAVLGTIKTGDDVTLSINATFKLN